MNRSYSDEGVVLTRKNYGEADRILVIFSKHHGRVSLLAKGIRRLTSRKRGHVEVFNYLKFQAVNGRGLDLIIETETIDDFQLIRKNLKKISLAYYFMEVVGRITHENEPNQELFDLILDYLDKLKTEKKLKKLRLNFITDILTVTGFWPKGKQLINPDGKLEEIIERQLNSIRVGKKIVK
jgi:DNA repair protein RecO (recombination protein O)